MKRIVSGIMLAMLFVSVLTLTFNIKACTTAKGLTSPANIAIAPLATPHGTLSFISTWGGGNFDYGRNVAVDSSGNIYITGDTQSFGAGGRDVFILKLNSTGCLVWQRTWGGSSDDAGYGVAVDSSGNIYVTGYTESFGEGLEDVFILKLNSTGCLVWQRTWGGSNWDRGLAITVDSSGSVYVTGYTLSYGYSCDFSYCYSAVFLLKLNSSGDLKWQRTWEEPYVAQGGSCIETDSLGNIYIAGYYGGLLLEFNSTGGLLLQRTWGNTNSFGSGDQCFGLALCPYGNIFITGQTSSFGSGGRDAFILRLSPTGDLVWQKTWGGTGNDEGRGVVLEPSGHIYVTGFTNSAGAGNYDVFLLELNSTGGLEQARTIGGIGDDEGFGIALDTHGNPVVGGYVSEASPYNQSFPNLVLGAPTFNLVTSSFPLTMPSAALEVPSGTVSTPSGSTTYSGDTDALLFMISSATAPSSPIGLVATPSVGQISLSWQAPISNGGSPVTGYKVYKGTSSGGEAFLTAIGNQTSYTDTAVGASTTCYYEVTAVNAVGESPPSAEVSATTPSVPSSPRGLSAQGGVNQVSLTWNAPSSSGGSIITGYKIYKGTTSGDKTVLTTVGNQTSYMDNSVIAGTTYYYKVAAINSVGESAPSNEASATTASVCSPPQNLRASTDQKYVTLSWTAPSSNGGSTITRYKIYRGTSSGAEILLLAISNQTSCTDSSVQAGTTYYYKVTAINAVGESGFSNEVSAKLVAPSTLFLWELLLAWGILILGAASGILIMLAAIMTRKRRTRPIRPRRVCPLRICPKVAT